MSSVKKELVETIFTRRHRWHMLSLYNTQELACTTCQATHKEIVADEITEERFCSEGISYLQRIQKWPSLA